MTDPTPSPTPPTASPKPKSWGPAQVRATAAALTAVVAATEALLSAGKPAAPLAETGAAQTAQYPIRPDPRLTPGDVLTTSMAGVCTPGYAAGVRNVSEETKRQAYAEYGILPRPGEHFEVDHLISLELGGSNDLKNLWPEPYFGAWNAHDKDLLENTMHEKVCRGDLPLAQAQQEIRTDWIACYHKYVDEQAQASREKSEGKGGEHNVS